MKSVVDRIVEDGCKIDDWAAIIGSRPLVVSVSGGKDSTAMILWLKSVGLMSRCTFVFADTKWEHPDLYKYIDAVIEPLCEGRLVRLTSTKYPGGMSEMVVKRGMFPSRMRRYCTQELKQFPIRDYIKSRIKSGDNVINVVGVRAAESRARSKLETWDRGGPMGKNIDVWRPLITWVVQDVYDIHARFSVRPCSLYLAKNNPAKRVGCWPCIQSRKSEIKAVAETTPDRIDEIRELERLVTIEAIARLAKKGETLESKGLANPAFFQAKTGGSGECWPIDTVVSWSKTSRGGKQFEMFAETEPGCASWGLCDVYSDE